ncbi:hypothetical protein [Deinococcus sp. UYEF24]
MKCLVALTVLLASCAPVIAQLQVQTPASSAPCMQTETITPVIGVAVQTYFDGDYYVEYTDAVNKALEMAGFKIQPDYAYPLPDLASILIKGRVDAWTTRSGDRSHRVGNVNLKVIDILISAEVQDER